MELNMTLLADEVQDETTCLAGPPVDPVDPVDPTDPTDGE